VGRRSPARDVYSQYREMYTAVGPENLQPGTLYRDHAGALLRSGTTQFPPEKAGRYIRERLIWRQNPQGTFDYSRNRGLGSGE
jgi:hypothetical protein